MKPFRSYIPTLITVCLAAGSVLAAPPAKLTRAEEAIAKRQRYVSRGWNIVATRVERGEQVLEPGTILFRQDLTPGRLVRLTTDLVDAKKGRTILPAGAVLFVVDAQEGLVACQLATDLKLKGKLETRPCLKDADRDGAVDNWSMYYGMNGVLPVVAGFWPKSPRPLGKPAGYEQLEVVPDDGKGFYVALRYVSINIFGKAVFELLCGHGDKINVVDTVEFASDNIPGTLPYSGAELRLLSVAGKKITVQIVSTMAAGPLSIYPRDSAFAGTG